MNKTGKVLTPKQQLKAIGKSLKKIDGLNHLETYAIFMGKVQLVEFGLKKLLIRKYRYDENRIERWTLGGTIRELKKNKLRGDFVNLLEELLVYRNELAHDYLATTAMGSYLVGKGFWRLQGKTLRHALFAVEQVIVVHDFLVEINGF